MQVSSLSLPDGSQADHMLWLDCRWLHAGAHGCCQGGAAVEPCARKLAVRKPGGRGMQPWKLTGTCRQLHTTWRWQLHWPYW